MMEELLKGMVRELPAVVALMIVVWWFLKSDKAFLRTIESQNSTFVKTIEAINARYDRMEKEHEEARKHSREVIEANTRTLARVAELMNRCERE